MKKSIVKKVFVGLRKIINNFSRYLKIMSDGEDDWFEKDIDDIVQEVQEKKKSNDEQLAILTTAPLQFSFTNDGKRNRFVKFSLSQKL